MKDKNEYYYTVYRILKGGKDKVSGTVKVNTLTQI